MNNTSSNMPLPTKSNDHTLAPMSSSNLSYFYASEVAKLILRPVDDSEQCSIHVVPNVPFLSSIVEAFQSQHDLLACFLDVFATKADDQESITSTSLVSRRLLQHESSSNSCNNQTTSLSTCMPPLCNKCRKTMDVIIPIKQCVATIPTGLAVASTTSNISIQLDNEIIEKVDPNKRALMKPDSMTSQQAVGDVNLNDSGTHVKTGEAEDCEEETDDDDDDSSSRGRFRSYQADRWKENLDLLRRFQEQRYHGPDRPSLLQALKDHDRSLWRWLKRQKYQYRLKIKGQSSTMTMERINALEEVGVTWFAPRPCTTWLKRVSQLQNFQRVNGHCKVPSKYPANPQLASWVKCQRRQYKFLCEGKPSSLTKARIAELTKMGFIFDPTKNSRKLCRQDRLQD